uniref:Uncharacterized protein n=1 Tax=Anguilla anguilla TaxID=7936 RepID=A0A0E9PJZ2_ANGAN
MNAVGEPGRGMQLNMSSHRAEFFLSVFGEPL